MAKKRKRKPSTETWKDPRGYTLQDRVYYAGLEDRSISETLLKRAIAAYVFPDDLSEIFTAYYLAQGLASFQEHLFVIFGGLGKGKGLSNARRLGANEVNRAHGEGVVDVSQLSPFIEGVKWNVSTAHAKSDRCDDLSKNTYPPDQVPPFPAHPLCKCFLSPTFTERAITYIVSILRDRFGISELV